jgi:hypothetical protein
MDELTSLAVYVITETASQDGKVGGPVNVITIEPGTGGSKFLHGSLIEQIKETNHSRAKALRDSFYKKEVDPS